MAYQLEKLMKELKTDVEKMIWDNNARVAGNDTTAREAAGMPSWLISNVDKASDATLATGDGTDAFTTGTARALTENLAEAEVRGFHGQHNPHAGAEQVREIGEHG